MTTDLCIFNLLCKQTFISEQTYRRCKEVSKYLIGQAIILVATLALENGLLSVIPIRVQPPNVNHDDLDVSTLVKIHKELSEKKLKLINFPHIILHMSVWTLTPNA